MQNLPFNETQNLPFNEMQNLPLGNSNSRRRDKEVNNDEQHNINGRKKYVDQVDSYPTYHLGTGQDVERIRTFSEVSTKLIAQISPLIVCMADLSKPQFLDLQNGNDV